MPDSLNGAYSDGGSEVLWEDGERVFRRGWRLDDNGERRPVLIVLPAADHPSRSSLDHLTHEHELRDELDEAWAVRPLDLVRNAGRTMLVLEDAGGEPLNRLLGAPMDVGRFLRLAVGIGVALGKIHQRGLVHKDIKPTNVLVNEATGEVRLTGFGIASRLARERQSPHPPETIAGTLAYMAPEQTGRMNRSIDSRSDLYALGVTFYQLLTGALPFTTADPMEWVHCHLARQPVAPAERLKEIPGAVSAIVMKLLAKRAEERYQTAAGLERDLRRCRAEWAAQGWIDDFPLGEHDTSDRLLIPERLYGRRREVETLLASFDRVIKGGTPELVLVSGYSGIGKSSVVNELQPVLVPPRGLFASGKFDQYKRDIPYSTLAQAFASLIRPLLGKSEADLAPWRDALRETLGPNARLIADLVPEVKLIIGEPPPVPELPPQDAQRRFQLVFQQFIGVFARPEHPLALFLDDLQWLDAATLDLLEDLLTRSDLRNVLLIGAYRDNEVTPAHPLMRKLEAIRASGRVQDIKLGPLTTEDLGGLVADALRCEAEQAAPLAGLVHAKTDGNPFFVIQFLHALADEGLLTFDHARARWSYDLGGIKAKRYTDNVVELLAGKLARLPLETQDAVRQLACLGNVAGVAMLSIVLGTPEEQVLAALWEALRQQLIERVERSYKFVHDRVQEAAYALIPEELRAEAHLTIGRLLVAQTPLEKREEAIFEIVNQLNRGAPLITSQEEREQLAELNLAAGIRAKASSAYASALTYFTAGAKLLPEDAWERRQELAFALELHSASCEVCTGALQAAEERLTALAPRAVGTVQRCVVAQRRADLYTMLGAGDRAVAVALECLRHLGIDWSAHPTEVETRGEYERFWSRLGTRAIEDIVDLPLMQDPEALATLDVLSSLIVPALYTDLNLSALSICRATNLNLERGNSDGAPANYVALGIIASARFGHYDQGYRFGKMGCDLLERRGLNHFGGRTYTLFAVLVPWTRPLGEAIDPARRAFQMAKEHGDPAFAALAIRDLSFNLLALGHPLDQIEREAEQGLEFVRRFGSFLDRVSAPLALVRTLRGRTTKFGSLDDGRFTERSFEERMADQPGPSFVECYYWIRKLQARFFAGDYTSAIDAAEKAERWYATSASLSLIMLQEAEYHFYAALSRAARCATIGPDSFATHREALGKHERQLRASAANCPQNFEDRAALVGAEIARIEGRPLDAMNLYERAIVSARANGSVHNEALAYELAARFYAARGFEEVAHLYVGNARRGYLRWGADGKVQQLDRLHSRLRQDERAPGPTGIIQAPVEQLDVATVIRVSQAVSSEMVLEKLIDRLMRTAIEYAGAERGLLIIPRNEELQIEAEAITHGEDVIVQLQDGAHAAALPESVVRYAMRTQESVILDDASSQNPFSAETYIVERRARSILCLPLINQARLIGILYLENNLTPHVFTRDRVTILKVLASQAAISLQNSRLYRDLANREGKIQRLVDANILGICIWNLDGAVVEANEAFLRMLQYGRDDVVSGRLRWTNLTPDEWREPDERAMAELRSTGTFQPVEKEYFRKDGSRLPVLIGGALFEENGTECVAFVLDLTQRKRAEDALREREAQLAEARRELRQLIDTIRTPVVSYSADNRRDFVNAAWKQYTGLSDEAALGPEWPAVTHPDHIAAGEKMWRDALATGKPWHTEERVRRADGQYRWFAIDRVAARDESGKIIKWYATGYDIDDRKRAEERLRVQHTVAQILAEAATIEEATPRILLAIGECLGWDVGVLWRVDREAKALRCVELWHTSSIEVPEFERVSRESTFGPGLGLPGRVWSSLEPEYIPDVVPDENFPRAPIAELEGLRAAFGFPILLGGEVLGVIEFFSREIKQPDEALLNVLATIGSQIGQFIERTRGEEALRESEAKIRRLVDANIIGIFIWDFDGRILEANEAFLHIVGYDHEDLVAGRVRWTDLTPPEWRDRDAQLIQEHRVAGTLQPFEKEYFRKDGSRVPVLIGVATFEGSEHQGVAFVIDLTERKRAEEALRRSEAWLAQAQRLSHIGTWVMNGTTRRFLYWSDESYRIWGLDPLQGLPSREDMWGRVHPDDRERVWGEVQEAMREQRDFFAKFRILLPDGTVRYLEANTRHEFSPPGALLEVI
jgi:PAS domain S-box-containing protein